VCVGYSRDGFHWSGLIARRSCPCPNSGRLELGERAVSRRMLSGGGRSAVFLRERPPRSPGLELPRHLQHWKLCHASTRRVRVDGPSGSGRVERLRQGPRQHIDHEAPSFSGRHLFSNVDAPDGELRVAMLDREGASLSRMTSARAFQSARQHPREA